MAAWTSSVASANSSTPLTGFVGGGELVTGEHWRADANSGVEHRAELATTPRANNVRHPGTPLGGERAPRSAVDGHSAGSSSVARLPGTSVRNTFVEVDGDDNLQTRARGLRRNCTDGDTPNNVAQIPPSVTTTTPSEQPPSQLRRLNEIGDSVPGSQDAALAERTDRQLFISELHSQLPRPTGGTDTSSGGRSRRRRLDAAGLNGLPSEPPPPVPDAFRHGSRFKCPWCGFHTPSSAGLMGHCTKRHAGEEIPEEHVMFWSSLGRATCRDCGFIRLRRGACRCGSSSLPRTVRAGDTITVPPLQPTDDSSRVETLPQIIRGEGGASSSAGTHTSTAAAGASALPTTIGPPQEHAPSTTTAGVGARGAVESVVPNSREHQAATHQEVHASHRAPRHGRRSAPMAPSSAHRHIERAPVSRQRRGAAPTMPDGFMEEVRGIRGPSSEHIPKALRERACAAFADGLEGAPRQRHLVDKRARDIQQTRAFRNALRHVRSGRI